MAALALLMGACSVEDNAVEEQVQEPANGRIYFSATIAAPNAGGERTRTTYTELSDGYINVAWKAKVDGGYEGDKIALIHNGQRDEVTVTAVAGDGSATIEGIIHAPSSAEEDVLLIYPAASVESATPQPPFPYTPNTTYLGKGFAQDGTLEYIQNNLDARQGSGKIISDGGSGGTLKEKVKMESKIAIWKLNLTTNGTTELSTKNLSLKMGAVDLAAAVSTTAKSEFYLCVVPTTMPATGNLTIKATDGTSLYRYVKTGGVTLDDNTYYKSTVTMPQVSPINLASASITSDFVAQDGDMLTGKLANNVKISIADGATVTLSDANINGDAGWLSNEHAGLTCEGDATIILADGTTNTVLGFHQKCSGIYIPSGKTLTIKGGAAGTGKLNAYGGRSGSDPSSNGYGAGIGAGEYASKSCGNIVIEGGDITATANSAAGIGCGYNSSCGDITIKGGTVHASSSSWYPGIGAGNSTSCGDITISGGNVTATSTGAAGIGCGYYKSTCGNITISGGTVNATGGYGAAGAAAGIGGAYTNDENLSNCGNILITDGTVTATGGTNTAGAGVGGAGIGSGSKCKSGTITIQGGSITATGGGNAAGIGAGIGGICGSISITGATFVDANKGAGGPYDIGIGSDLSETYKSAIKDGDTPGTVTIAAGVATSDGTKHYTVGTAANGYNKH